MDSARNPVPSPEETHALIAAAAVASPYERMLIEEQIVTDHGALANRIAHRYSNRGIDLDDLLQVANMGLVHAVRRFNAERGQFIAFAAVTMSGEIKKYFRDNAWMVRPPRSVQLLQAAMARAEENAQQGGTTTFDIDRLADEFNVDRSAVIDAAAARGCFTASSLDAPTFGEGPSLGDNLVAQGCDLDVVDGWVDFCPAWNTLDEAERLLLKLRFYDDLTQAGIAQLIGCSQMQVSRRIAAVLRKVREVMSVPHAA